MSLLSGLVQSVEKAGATAGRALRSRRDLFALGALAAAWRAAAKAVPGEYQPLAKHGPSETSWLVNRLGYGTTGADLALAESLGWEGYLEYQLDYEAIDDSALDARLAPYTTLGMTPQELVALQRGQVIAEQIEAAVIRSLYSRRQLYERMVEFWTDHFNIDINLGEEWWLKPVDDREVIRTYALGNFGDLLRASAHSPAMLYYLDNHVSVVGNPNENYGRELLELHTMGVTGGYTQHDVEEVARCFTGWGLFFRNQGANTGRFRFTAAQHDNGAKVVLGVNIPAGGGINDGETVLNLLINHPSTGRFVSQKMCNWLWGPGAPDWVVDAVSDTYFATGGEIKDMIRTIFALRRDVPLGPTKYKRPYHHFIATLRGLNANLTNLRAIRTQLAAAGHVPFSWGPPDGYPDTLEYWVGGILPRWNFGFSLVNNQLSGATVDPTAFFAGLTTADQMVARINQVLFGGQMSAVEQEEIRAFLAVSPGSLQRKRDALALATSAPGFQWF
ncbi:MAG: DUF1800 domain-containing protein [Phycisphaerae bacterium]